MHGCDSDVLWLQRDFGLYLVGVFDTGQAARVLEFPSFSLAHLLKSYCGVTASQPLRPAAGVCAASPHKSRGGVQANKTYQMADWRLRPLTAEMITYAREDTHYLLYIYDQLKRDIAET